jgi:hypothetical protein
MAGNTKQGAHSKTGILNLPPVLVKTLIIIAFLGPIVFQVALISIQIMVAGYDPVRDAISTLVFSRYGWLQTAVFYFFGISLLALAVIIHYHFRSRFNAGAAAIAMVGIAFILIGACHSPSADVVSSIPGSIHHYSTISVMGLFPLACFLLTPVFKSGDGILRTYSICTGAFGVLFFFLGGLFLASNQTAAGLFERVLLANGHLWVEIVCVTLIIKRMKERSSPLPEAVS